MQNYESNVVSKVITSNGVGILIIQTKQRSFEFEFHNLERQRDEKFCIKLDYLIGITLINTIFKVKEIVFDLGFLVRY